MFDDFFGEEVQRGSNDKMLTFCILNYNDPTTTTLLLKEITGYECIDKIVVVDNCSTDNSLEVLSAYQSEKVRIISTDRNGGYGYGNNYGILYAKANFKSKYICIANPDISISEAALQKCEQFIRTQKDCIIVAPIMVDRDENRQVGCGWPIQSGIRYLLFSLKVIGKYFNDYYEDLLKGMTPYVVDCVAGSCLLIDSDKFVDIGLYDEKLFLYCEETLIGIKARKNKYASYILRDITFKHLHSVSISKTIQSNVKQKKLMWESRLYVLRNYYNWNACKMVFAGMISCISIFEEKLQLVLKR